MKNIIILIIALNVTAVSCTCKNILIGDKQGTYFQRLYDFDETLDSFFCNPDSIISTDCGGGNLYFTKKGYVLYCFFCLGSDTTIYSIGRYEIIEDGIYCTFNQTYSFYNGENIFEEIEKEIDPNNGVLKDTENWSIRLKKINCVKYEYSFNGEADENFVLSKSDTQNSDFFFRDFKKIKIFSNL